MLRKIVKEYMYKKRMLERDSLVDLDVANSLFSEEFVSYANDWVKEMYRFIVQETRMTILNRFNPWKLQ